MRDIRFRAWNKKYDFMMPYVMVAAYGYGRKCKYDGEWWEDTDIEVMQYTGLHDKNGKEIYEGDIILAGHAKWKCKVIWDEMCARFIGMTNDKDVKIVYVDMVDKNNKSAVEVVGNIYENPELLNPQN